MLVSILALLPLGHAAVPVESFELTSEPVNAEISVLLPLRHAAVLVKLLEELLPLGEATTAFCEFSSFSLSLSL